MFQASTVLADADVENLNDMNIGLISATRRLEMTIKNPTRISTSLFSDAARWLVPKPRAEAPRRIVSNAYEAVRQ
jgi:hypothetical protein